MKGVLHYRYLSHFSLLASSIYLLLQDNITQGDLRAADDLLFEFVVTFELLYGVSSMTSNVHQLLHMTRSVQKWGPLWSHSAFPFEDWNGKLLKLVHGTRSVSHQVLQRLPISMAIEELMGSSGIGARTARYCQDALGRGRLMSYDSSDDGLTTGLGVGRIDVLNTEEMAAISAGGSDPPPTGTTFQRVVHEGTVLSRAGRGTKRCDAVVMVDGGLCIEICKLVLISADSRKTFFLFGRPCIPFLGHGMRGLPSFQKVLRVGDELAAVPSSSLRAKCVVVRLDNAIIVSEMPSKHLGD